MLLILISLAVFLVGAISALFFGKKKSATIAGTATAIIGSLLLISPVIRVLISGKTVTFVHFWNIPGGHFSLNLDPLAAFFLVPLLIVSIAAALFGSSYLPQNKRRNGLSWFTFNLLILSMILIVLANNGVLFLLAWELMALTSLLLVLYEHEDVKIQKAGWVYIAASHAGAAFLFPLFFILAKAGNGFDFSGVAIHSITGIQATFIFFLALVGFGCKAGFMPLHVWLPEAHPAAPSHVSALMSAVMIKMGIYGILRMLTFLETPHVSWGITLLFIGVISGVLGVMFALGQRDIKRLLAYSSVENIGIIACGFGIGLLGETYNNQFIAAIGFTGALLHIINHAFFKGLLFMCAGAVAHATGTRDMERLGGLLKKMPFTGVSFLIGAIAICGLPPLNGFLSEFLIYIAGFSGVINQATTVVFSGLLIIGALALIGGLAVAAFTKSFGVIFLGEPRATLQHTHFRLPFSMKISFIIMVVACICVCVFFPLVKSVFYNPVSLLTVYNAASIKDQLFHISNSFYVISIASLFFVLLLLVFIFIRKGLLKKRIVTESVTWGCGYAQPTARIQYTGSSFVEPIISFFSSILHPRKKVVEPKHFFPVAASFHNEVEDVFMRHIFVPMFVNIFKAFTGLRWLQGGKVHAYVLYIALAVITALVVTFTM